MPVREFYADITVDGNVTADAHITNGGDINDFVKGDGSLDPNTYLSTVPDLNEVALAGNTTGEILNIGQRLTVFNTSQYIEGGTNSLSLRSTGVISLFSNSVSWLSLHATGMNFSSTGGLAADTVTLATNLITAQRYQEFPNKDGTFAMTSDLIANTDTTYTYDAIAHANGAILRLIGSDVTNDDILLNEGVGIDITQNTAGQITISNTANNTYTISQTGLGLLVGINKLIYQDASGWGLANATDDTKVAAGIVASIIDNDTITYQAGGEFAYSGGGLTVGSVYWLDALDGAATATEPTTNYIQPVFQALSSTLALLTFEPMLVYTDATNYFGVEEAPLDGQQYGRQSAAWTVISAAGAMTSFDILANGLSKTINDGEIVEFVDGKGTIAELPTSLNNEVTFNIKYDGTGSNGDSNFIATAVLTIATLSTADQIVYKDVADGVVKRCDVRRLPFTNNLGTITEIDITAGDGLTGTVNTTSGVHSQTLNVVTGVSSGLVANADNIAISYGSTFNFIQILGETTSLSAGDTMVIWDDSASFSRQVLFTDIKVRDLDDTNIMYDNEVNGYTKAQYFDLTTNSITAGHTWDLSLNQVYKLTFTSGSNTISVSNQSAGATYVIVIVNTAGTASINWTTSFKFADGAQKTLTSGVSGSIDVFTFVSDGTTMYGSGQFNYG